MNPEEPKKIWIRINGIGYTKEESDAMPKNEWWRGGVGPQICRDYEAYNCPVTGRRIEGKAAHLRNLQALGCRVIEEGEARDAARNRAATRDRDLSSLSQRITKQILDRIN